MSTYLEIKKGIGGWLIVPAFGLVLAPLGHATVIFHAVVFFYSEEYGNLSSRFPALACLALLRFLVMSDCWA